MQAARRRSGAAPPPQTLATTPPVPAGDTISSLRDALSDVAYASACQAVPRCDVFATTDCGAEHAAVAQRKHTIALLTNKLHDLEAEATAAQACAQPATNISSNGLTPCPQEADAAIAALNAAADEEAELLEEECRELGASGHSTLLPHPNC